VFAALSDAEVRNASVRIACETFTDFAHQRLAPPPPAVEAFFQKFTQIYESHGGLVAAHPQHGKKPWMGPGNLSDGGEMVQKVWNLTGNR
jgi:hypothetical protein